MSAAQAVRVETLPYFEAPSVAVVPRDAMCDLVHELRQPLSSVEAIAYFLEMTLPADQVQARQYMTRIQQLVEQAEAILKRAGSGAPKPVASAHAAGR